MTSMNTRFCIRKNPNVGGKTTKLTVQFIDDSKVGKVITESVSSAGKNVRKTAERKDPVTVKTRKLKQVGKNDTFTDEESCSSLDTSEFCQKPTGLFDENDVGGQEMCSFKKTPSKHEGMLQKAQESSRKNKTPLGTPKNNQKSLLKSETPCHKITPNSSRRKSVKNILKKTTTTPKQNPKESNVVVPKTPYSLRTRHKKAIQSYTRKLQIIDSSTDDDDEDSDYEGSDGSEHESDCESLERCSDSDSGKDSGEARSCRRSLRFQQLPSSLESRKKSQDTNYVFTADDYFNSKSSKCITSDHNLSKLKTSRLDSHTLNSLLTNFNLSDAHNKVLDAHLKENSQMFQRWMFALSQGFSILAYGLGSKFKILQDFRKEMIPESHALEVNGFFPSLNIREIVETIAKDMLGLKQILPSPHSMIDWIESRRWMPRIFLLVHNIDGEMLRCEKTQAILARLANLPKVHLVASVDHINSSLLWDQAKLSSFNFIWEDTTSFLPYQEETSYETSLMVQNSGSLALSSLLNVYHSLTQNSRGVFRIILQKHLDENNPKYAGMAFSELYGRCREEMLVTSDLALRTMLTEFFDHQMVKWRRDGEHLHIPTDIAILRQFHKQIQNH